MVNYSRFIGWGNGVDVEALCDRIPLRHIAEKGPKMGSHGYRRLRRWKSGFMAPPDVFRVYEYIQAKELGRWSYEGPTRVGARLPPGRALLPRGFLVASPTSSPTLMVCFRSQKDHCKGFILFGLRLLFLFCKTLKQAKKQKLALGPRLIGSSQK